MSKATKTVNPLHFEDLEPHRFEDLVRQLAYDFRDWRSLEATGRSGSDEGFDVRGWEIVHVNEKSEEDEEEPSNEPLSEDKLWLIQCKREKSITPKKIQKYIKDITKDATSLYGIILVAPCDFSKKTRDTFIQELKESGISEIHLWGRAELEDMLFQPKNDHLLFAYFGISLIIKRRSLKTQIRSKLVIKRKAIKYIGDIHDIYRHKSTLLRDPEESRYPYANGIKDFDKFPKWKIYYFLGHEHNGLKFLIRRYFAYLADDKVSWDCFEEFDESRPFEDPWHRKIQSNSVDESALRNFWMEIPEQNRAWVENIGIVLYEKIIDIDENGDVYFNGPHVYVPFTNSPFDFSLVCLTTIHGENKIYLKNKTENRIKYFPDSFPILEKNKQKDPK